MKSQRKIGNKKTVVGIFIDLSKAFDTIDHDMLLDKLSLCGIHATARKWFLSHLSNRQQYVQIPHIKSKICYIVWGTCHTTVFNRCLDI